MKKLLIVEDSKTYNNMLQGLLRDPSYEIFQAYDLTQAREVLLNNKIDLILLDLQLNNEEGDELIVELSSNNPHKTKIAVITVNEDPQRRDFLFDNGVIDFFSKNIPIKILVNDIKKLISTLSRNREKNILVIDDSSFVRNLLHKILSTRNYNVYTKNDGEEGINFVKENPSNINLILLDIEMPKIDGMKVLEDLKSNDETKNIPIIILTSVDSKNYYSHAIKQGASDFMKKPFLAEEILLKVEFQISQADNIEKIAAQAQELKEYKRVLNESDIISKTTPKGIIKEVNEQFCKTSGYSTQFLMGKSHRVVRHPDMPSKVFKDLWASIKEHTTFKAIIKNKRKDGTAYYVDATISPIIGTDGKIKEIIGIRHDITDVMNPKKQLIADLSYLENPTLVFLKIANYSLFKEFYSESLMHIFEFEFEKYILKYAPKALNLTLTYNLQDGLFAFVNNDYLEEDTLRKALQEFILEFGNKGIVFKETNYDVDIYMSYSRDNENILDDAYIGIREGLKNKTTITDGTNFHKKVQIEAKNKLKSIGMIKNALLKDENIISYFQPIINNKTGEIEKYESLVRLIDEDGIIVSPHSFLHLAKKTGYYSDITELVIKNSFKALEHTSKKISINLSFSDIENPQTRDFLWENITKKENIGRIVFELLEDEEIKNFDLVKEFIFKSKLEGGVQIAIDDFGSGYSNYERLLEFQPDILKIDGSLIKKISHDSYSRHVVESIMVFAKKQHIKTVAEFVTHEKILECVKELGIDYSQGYYLGEPQKLF